MEDLRKPAKIALTECLGVKPDEEVLIVTNPELMDIAEALFVEAKNLKANVSIEVYPAGKMNGEEPPEDIAAKMLKPDVLIAPTLTSISHTNARRKATAKGVRIATMPGITNDIFIRGMSADYNEISKLTKRVNDYLDNAKTAHVYNSYGMDLKLNIDNPAEVCDGKILNPGDFTNLPDGETCLSPITADGVLVSHRCDDYITEATKLVLKDGHIVEYDSNPSGQRFKKLVDDSKSIDGNENAGFIAEFAIGTNPSAIVNGNILEDEKVLGTCHIAFGDNTSFVGGSNMSTLHMDIIIIEPTIILDDKKIMEAGKLLI